MILGTTIRSDAGLLEAGVPILCRYRLPADAGVTLADLTQSARTLLDTGYEPVSAWLVDDAGALVGFALGARRPRATEAPSAARSLAAQVDAFREAAGADLAHAVAEWAPA